jgi:carboxymethylenebutenolidase
MVFYGTGPTDAAAYANITAPVVAFYGGADERVNATIPLSEQTMSSAGKRFDYQVYEGAGHAFMRLGEDTAGDPANVSARQAALERMKAQLQALID